jgi:hypothetical protein
LKQIRRKKERIRRKKPEIEDEVFLWPSELLQFAKTKFSMGCQVPTAFFFIKAKTDTAPAVEALPVDGRKEMATGGDEVCSEDFGVLPFRTFESFHADDDVVIVEPLL